jgi:hypothetical protein
MAMPTPMATATARTAQLSGSLNSHWRVKGIVARSISMREFPILFSTPMVRAILDGRKTVTRRVLKPQPPSAPAMGGAGRTASANRQEWVCPYGAVGDRLWVKETYWAFGKWTQRFDEAKGRDVWSFEDHTAQLEYRYDADELNLPARKREPNLVGWWKRPALFMPKKASRILLERTGTNVDRVQGLSTRDILAEGVQGDPNRPAGPGELRTAWRDLWSAINGVDSWEANPWVWVVEFRRIDHEGTRQR